MIYGLFYTVDIWDNLIEMSPLLVLVESGIRRLCPVKVELVILSNAELWRPAMETSLKSLIMSSLVLSDSFKYLCYGSTPL